MNTGSKFFVTQQGGKRPGQTASNGWEYSFLQFYRTFPLLKELLGAILKEDGGKAVLKIQVLKFGIKDIGLIGKVVDFIVEGVPPLPLPIMTFFSRA